MAFGSFFRDDHHRRLPFHRRSLQRELRHLARGLARTALKLTRDIEYGCGDVYELMDQYVDLETAGEDPRHLMPLLHLHLSICGDCSEELEALRRSIRALR